MQNAIPAQYRLCSQIIFTQNEKIIQVLALLACAIIAGCGGGGGERSTTSTSFTSTTDTSTSIIKLAGSVGDGPVIGANIKVLDAYGKIIVNTTSDNNANYSIDVPPKTAFPLTITAIGGTDIVSGLTPDFSMQTVAFKRSELNRKHTVNINPFSTFVVKIAQSMPGGLSSANTTSAKQILFDSFSFGLDQNLINDPITSDITDNNVAEVIKASEAMGEMIRRTRDALISSGSNVDGNYIITNLSNDLADGILDANGANVAANVTATAKIVSAQVLIENMQNKLKVYDVLATNALNNAVLTSRPSSTKKMNDVKLTSSVITQTSKALSAAQRFAPTTGLSSLSTITSGLTTSMSINDITNAFSSQSSDILTNIIDLVPTATTEQIDIIINDNSVASTNNSPDSGKIIRVNAGGGEYVDSKGQVWSADYGYNLGQGISGSNSISGTIEDTLYQSVRWHSTYTDATAPELEYRFTVPAGNYAIRLHFTDWYKSLRLYDVEIEGNLVIDNLDVKNEVGLNASLVKHTIVKVTDGALNIRFPRDTQSPWIAAIEVIEVTTLTGSIITANDDVPVSITIPEATSGTGTLSIIGQPSNGNAVASGTNIIYTSNSNFSGQDTIIYTFIDAIGAVTVSTLNITVQCDSCLKEAIIVLRWQPNPEAVSGYRIYYGPDPENATTLATDVAEKSGLIDPTAPMLEFATITDLNFYPGEQVCFKVQAYTDTYDSAHSKAVCGTI